MVSPIKINTQKDLTPIAIDVPEALVTIAEPGCILIHVGEPNQYILLRSNYGTDTKWVENKCDKYV